MQGLVKQLKLTIPLEHVIGWIKGGVIRPMEATKNLNKVKPSCDLDPSVKMSILGIALQNIIVDGGVAVNVLPTQT